MVLVTAQHDLNARFRGSRVGADDFLFLPVNRLELVARVKSLLRLRTYFKDLEESRPEWPHPLDPQVRHKRSSSYYQGLGLCLPGGKRLEP